MRNLMMVLFLLLFSGIAMADETVTVTINLTGNQFAVMKLYAADQLKAGLAEGDAQPTDAEITAKAIEFIIDFARRGVLDVVTAQLRARLLSIPTPTQETLVLDSNP